MPRQELVNSYADRITMNLLDKERYIIYLNAELSVGSNLELGQNSQTVNVQ